MYWGINYKCSVSIASAGFFVLPWLVLPFRERNNNSSVSLRGRPRKNQTKMNFFRQGSKIEILYFCIQVASCKIRNTM